MTAARMTGAAASQASEAHFRRAIAEAPLPIMLHAEDGRVLLISRAWTEITGYQARDIPTIADWTERAYGERRGVVRADIDRLYALDRSIDEGEYIVRTADGTQRVWAFRSAPVGRAADGQRLVVSVATDVTERRREDERLRLLAAEIDHRSKNLFALVLAVVRMTRGGTVAEFITAATGRIAALARAHSLLVASRWDGADLQRLIEDEMAPFRLRDGARVAVNGRAVALSPRAAQPVAMALHELATNAAKYGALSAPTGRVAIEWAADEQERLTLRWVERGGPPAPPPQRQGLGIGLMAQVIRGQLGGEIRSQWGPEGLVCDIVIPAGGATPHWRSAGR